MIWEFIKAYKEAYRNVCNDRLIAKSKINDVKRLIKSYEITLNKAEKIKKLLYDINGFLPMKQRTDYVQKTIDLLMYGFDITASSEKGMIGNYKSIITSLKGYLNQMQKSYKKHEYKDVCNICDSIDNMIKHKFDIWGIKY